MLHPTASILPPGGLFHTFASRIAALPTHTPLARADVLTDDFLLARAELLELYYAPFDYVNEQARVVLVGIAPGWYQVERAFATARDALLRGASETDASRLARTTASFSGPIRRNLVVMLDGIGLPAALGITSGWELWGERHNLLHTSAVVRYPVFVRGGNWTGYNPDPLRHPLLSRFVTEALANELSLIPSALVIPFGKSVAASLAHLARTGALDPSRLLPGLPHPSGANAHRPAQFALVREEAAARVQAYFGA